MPSNSMSDQELTADTAYQGLLSRISEVYTTGQLRALQPETLVDRTFRTSAMTKSGVFAKNLSVSGVLREAAGGDL